MASASTIKDFYFQLNNTYKIFVTVLYGMFERTEVWAKNQRMN